MEKTACQACGNPTAEQREGYCWECATAESIIADGTDMYDKGPCGTSKPAKGPMEKLKYLIAKGWNYSGNPALINKKSKKK